jgi:hypothetical protein
MTATTHRVFSMPAYLAKIHKATREASTSIKGAWAELIACAWLMEQGFEVFRNVCPTGWVDVVAWKAGEWHFIDVKSVRFNPASCGIKKPSLRDAQVHAGVKTLFVTEDGICSFNYEDILALYSTLDRERRKRQKRS